MAYGVYSDRGYREHIIERNKNTNKTEVFTQEDQSFTGRKTFLSGVTTSDLEVQTVEVSESLKVKGKDITEIIDYLPNDVSKENKLTTKDFVNSSIATNTANFLGTFNTLEEIEALTDVTNNDYAFWKTTDTLGSVVFKRYKYIADEQLWKFEYDLNNSSFTAEQWKAINSGITAELVALIGQGGGSALVPSITQEQYNNLTEVEKNNGQIREITNTNPKKVMLNGMDLNEQLNIDDTKFTTGNVWSAEKTKAEIESVDNKNNYSTEETVIGKWIDGKPIYRKVFSDPNNSWGASDNIIGNITNLKEPTSIKAIAFNDTGVSGWVENNEGGESRCYAYIKSNGEVHFYRSDIRDGIAYPKKVITEYTKTTD